MTVFRKWDRGLTRDGRMYTILDMAGHILYVAIDGTAHRHYKDGSFDGSGGHHPMDLLPPTHNKKDTL